jgi:hypothetical protein
MTEPDEDGNYTEEQWSKLPAAKKLRLCANNEFQIYPDDMTDAANHIEKLEAALVRIWAWHPISVSQPRKTLDEIRDFAFATIKGDEK